MAQEKKYCYLEPVYPEKGYVVAFFIFRGERAAGSITLPSLYEDLSEASSDIAAILKDVDLDRVQVPKEAMLLPVHFHSTVPLKKAYWTKPSMQYDEWERSKLFTSVFLHPELYYLLATPTVIGKKNKTQWRATLPLSNPDDTKLIETFMYTSDQVVDPKAKYAALYTFEKEKRYNWVTQTVSEVEDKIQRVN